jgi:hypothetical protein
MAFEKFLEAISPQFFLEDGTDRGRIAIDFPFYFKVRQTVLVKSFTQPVVELQIKRVEDFVLYVGPKDNRPDTRADLTAFLRADFASIEANEQRRPDQVDDQPYNQDDLEHEEEPTNAKRAVLVGRGGDPVDVFKLGVRTLNFLGNEPLERQVKTAVDYNGDNNPIRIGEAAPGSSIYSPAWRIKSIVYSGLNPIRVLWANGNTKFDKVYAATAGPAPATGHVHFHGNPVDGDTITFGTETYEFDDNASVGGGNIAVTIGATTLNTAENFLIALAGSTVVQFDQDDSYLIDNSPHHIGLTVVSIATGLTANTIPFTISSTMMAPFTGPPPFFPYGNAFYTGFLGGAVEQITVFI